MMRIMRACLIAVVCLAFPAAVMAQEQHGEQPAEQEHHGEAEEHAAAEGAHGEPGDEEGHGEGHHLHKHHIAVIFSATEAVEEHGDGHNGNGHGEGHGGRKDDPDFTVGFDYERRLTQLFGFGGMFDWVAEGRREVLLGPIAFLHPFAGSKLWVAPLAERVRETGDWELLVRFGVGWDIPVGKSGKYSIAPNINYDISEEHELWVVGFAIGKGF